MANFMIPVPTAATIEKVQKANALSLHSFESRSQARELLNLPDDEIIKQMSEGTIDPAVMSAALSMSDFSGNAEDISKTNKIRAGTFGKESSADTLLIERAIAALPSNVMMTPGISAMLSGSKGQARDAFKSGTITQDDITNAKLINSAIAGVSKGFEAEGQALLDNPGRNIEDIRLGMAMVKLAEDDSSRFRTSDIIIGRVESEDITRKGKGLGEMLGDFLEHAAGEIVDLPKDVVAGIEHLIEEGGDLPKDVVEGIEHLIEEGGDLPKDFVKVGGDILKKAGQAFEDIIIEPIEKIIKGGGRIGKTAADASIEATKDIIGGTAEAIIRLGGDIIEDTIPESVIVAAEKGIKHIIQEGKDIPKDIEAGIKHAIEEGKDLPKDIKKALGLGDGDGDAGGVGAPLDLEAEQAAADEEARKRRASRRKAKIGRLGTVATVGAELRQAPGRTAAPLAARL